MKLNLLIVVFLTALLWSCGSEKEHRVKISTEYGDMTFKLYNHTPDHRDNFIKLVKEGYYDGTLFHRVMDGFMIQGGDPDSRDAPAGKRLGFGGPGYTIPAEIGVPHFKGTLAAARTGGPSNPDKRSSGSQFYIVHGTKPNMESSIINMGKNRGLTYNDAQVAKYMELGGTPMLDGDYTVFGEIIDGMEVIDKIAVISTDANDRPLEDVPMKVTLL